MSQTRIVIVDEMPVVRGGIRRVVEAEPDLKVVGEASDADSALNLVRESSPDVVVMEVKGKALDGLSLCRELGRLFPQIGLVFVTSYDGPFYFFQALRSGCHAYIPKSALPAEVVTGIRSAARLEYYIHPFLGRWLVQDFTTRLARPRNGRGQELAPRELQTLELLSQGFTSQEIAQRLVVSINTVRRHRARLLRKVGAHGVGDLIRVALEQGLLEVLSGRR